MREVEQRSPILPLSPTVLLIHFAFLSPAEKCFCTPGKTDQKQTLGSLHGGMLKTCNCALSRLNDTQTLTVSLV